ncbi:MAG: winged helix-turn-helix transcriptional regulator, partial [Spirochaetes bacterium]|nr:winged helix-turn-helix transcriptional regulator [Spirochaetota bacterium]
MSYPNLAAFPARDLFRSRLGRVLGHPARLEILRLTAEKPRPFSEVFDLLGMRRRTLSRHLQFLVQRKLLIAGQEGGKTWYRVEEGRLLREVRRMEVFFREMKGRIRGRDKGPISHNSPLDVKTFVSPTIPITP